LDDLIAYGQIGLAEAARDYHPGRGSQFTPYAYYRIRGAIYDGISKMSWTSRSRYHRLRYEQMANETLREMYTADDDTTQEGDANWLRRMTERLTVVYLSSGCLNEAEFSDALPPDPSATPPVEVASREIAQKLRNLAQLTYPLTPAGGDDQLRLGRGTDWQGPESGPVRGVGLRTFLAGEQDKTILELQEFRGTAAAS
jgi:RNA polymerase sigma factor for flagellar operon FliA